MTPAPDDARHDTARMSRSEIRRLLAESRLHDTIPAPPPAESLGPRGEGGREDA